MTPALLLRSLEEALRPLIVAEKGVLHVCDSPDDTLGLLSVKPAGFRCVLQWAGHDGDGDTYGSSKVGRIAVIVQTAKGHQADRGADAHRPPAVPGAQSELPILDLVATVATFIRSLRFTQGDEGELRDDIQHHRAAGRHQCFTEIGGDWLEVEGVALRQYQTNFSIRYTDDPAS